MADARYPAANPSCVPGTPAGSSPHPRAPRYRSVLFDLDGTLLDTIEDLAQAGNSVCAHFGWPPYSLDEYKRKVGNGQRKLAERIVPPQLAGDRALADKAYELFCAHYEAHALDHTRPYPGLTDLVDHLRERGVSMGVLTNKNDDAAQRVVAHFFGRRLPVVQGRRDGVPAKPDPTMTRALMQRLGADPASTLMVGDTPVDIACGVNAGIDACGVLWGFRGREELTRAGAAFLVATAQELEMTILGE